MVQSASTYDDCLPCLCFNAIKLPQAFHEAKAEVSLSFALSDAAVSLCATAGVCPLRQFRNMATEKERYPTTYYAGLKSTSLASKKSSIGTYF